jgi:beta-xylosidase
MYAEGPWLYKRGEIYYMIFSAECCPQNLQYAMGPSATGPWTYGGVIMNSAGTSETNHAGIVEFKDSRIYITITAFSSVVIVSLDQSRWKALSITPTGAFR